MLLKLGVASEQDFAVGFDSGHPRCEVVRMEVADFTSDLPALQLLLPEDVDASAYLQPADAFGALG